LTTVKLEWTANSNHDFKRYRIHMALASGFEPSDETLHETIDYGGATNLTLDGLRENTRHYFVVEVFDSGGLGNRSNEAEALTANAPPNGVTLFDAEDVGENSFSLRWTQSDEHDFDRYAVLLSESPDFTDENAVHIIPDRNVTHANVTDVAPAKTYYVILRVYDTGGLHSDSLLLEVATAGRHGNAFQVPLTVIGLACILVVTGLAYAAARSRRGKKANQ
jgi:hypothetical protein